MHPDLEGIRCAIVRGGTSKGIFIIDNELPQEKELRDRVIQAIFGSPDIRQIDGLGGADTLTSKLAIVARSTREDADIDYTFAQVGIDQDVVDYSGNCGNISAGVGPFAIDNGLVQAVEPITIVRIYQKNTDKILIAEVPVKDGKALTDGDFKIDGVPGAGAKITMDFSDTVGSQTGRLLPTGNVKDTIVADGKEYEISIVDAGNPLVFIKAESLDMKGTETPTEIEGNKALMKTIELIRGQAAQMIGLVKDSKEAAEKSPYIPFFAIVSPSNDYIGHSGMKVSKSDAHLVSRLLFMLKMHKTYPGTGAVCTGAAVRIPGSVAYEVLSEEGKASESINIGHPSGVMQVESTIKDVDKKMKFSKLAFYRTARRIMDGNVYVKKSIFDGDEKKGV